MKFRMLLIAAMMAGFMGTAYAEKPEWAGKGKPTDEQKAAHKEAMTSKHDDKMKKDKKGKDGDDMEGMHEDMGEGMEDMHDGDMMKKDKKGKDGDDMMEGEDEGEEGMEEKKAKPGPKGDGGAKKSSPKKEKEWYNFWD